MIYFPKPIEQGLLVKRFKRFFLSVKLADGSIVNAHCPNTGSMLGLLKEGSPVLLSKSQDPKRKTPFTAQAIKIDSTWVGINTMLPNKLFAANLTHPALDFLSSYQDFKAEVPFGEQKSRADFLFSNSQEKLPPCYVEIKSVTLKIGKQAQFPDAVSSRAFKHVEELLFMKTKGFLAALVFIVQRDDCESFAPANQIHEAYGQKLKEAREKGLIIQAISSVVNEEALTLGKTLPCLL